MAKQFTITDFQTTQPTVLGRTVSKSSFERTSLIARRYSRLDRRANRAI